MAYDKEKRYSIETISIYYKNANDMVIIGCFNDPHGPRRECGQPYVIRESVSPEKLGSILSNLYDKCLQFSKDDNFCRDNGSVTRTLLWATYL